jgi:hypothetical protein
MDADAADHDDQLVEVEAVAILPPHPAQPA